MLENTFVQFRQIPISAVFVYTNKMVFNATTTSGTICLCGNFCSFAHNFYAHCLTPNATKKVISKCNLGPLHMSLVIGLVRLPGQILWCVYMGNFSPVDEEEFKKHNQNGGT